MSYEPVVPPHKFLYVLRHEEVSKDKDALDVKTNAHPMEDGYPEAVDCEDIHIDGSEGSGRDETMGNERVVTSRSRQTAMLVSGFVNFDKSFRRGLAPRDNVEPVSQPAL